MSDRAERVRAQLVGSRPFGQLLVVTPIPAIFETLLLAGWREYNGTSWWRRATMGEVEVVLIPQGGGVADLGLCTEATTRIELLGYAGSLSPTIQVGDIVQPSATRLLGSRMQHPLTGGTRNTTIVTTTHLLAAYDAGAAELAGADVVDMESAHLASSVSRAGGPVPTVRVLITDRVPDRPFYVPPSGAPSSLRRRRQDLVDEFVSEIREGR